MQPGACNTKLSIHFRTATYEGTQYTTLQCSIRCLCSAKFNPLHGEYSFETRYEPYIFLKKLFSLTYNAIVVFGNVICEIN